MILRYTDSNKVMEHLHTGALHGMFAVSDEFALVS